MNVFIDKGFTDSETFCIQFLQSPEFKLETLKMYSDYHPDKSSAATDVARKIRIGEVDIDQLMLDYAKQPRQWFALKVDGQPELFEAKDPKILLTQFGEEDWYGPIENKEDHSHLYLRTHAINEFKLVNDGSDNAHAEILKIRWTIVANVSDSHISFNWNGFTTNSYDNPDSRYQFQFWNYIPKIIDDLEDSLSTQYSDPNFHSLILDTIWNRYISNPDYTWNHLAVRAEASGVALNARTSGVRLINVEGLLGLARRLATAVINEIEGRPTTRRLQPGSRRARLIEQAENQIIKTLIKDWGTKSYEFRLLDGDEKIFRAHSYFGLKPEHHTQDRFSHFKAYLKYGGAYKAIEFLLDEMDR